MKAHRYVSADTVVADGFLSVGQIKKAVKDGLLHPIIQHQSIPSPGAQDQPAQELEWLNTHELYTNFGITAYSYDL